MLKEYFQVATSKSQQKELDILVQSLVILVSKKNNLQNEVHSWKNQLEILSKIAEIQPQAAYSAYMFGFKHKFTFFLRTVPDITDYLLPIEETLRSRFISQGSYMFRCRRSGTCTSSGIRRLRITEPL